VCASRPSITAVCPGSLRRALRQLARHEGQRDCGHDDADDDPGDEVEGRDGCVLEDAVHQRALGHRGHPQVPLALALLVEQAPAQAFAPTSLLLVGLGVTGGLATGAFAVQMWVQRIVPAQQVALIFASEPAYAAGLSWYFLGETLDLQGWIGSGLILLAVLVGAFGSGPQSSSPSVGTIQPA